MVQLYLNNSECDLYGNETIATDYSIAPISDISTRNGAKSISFKIPLTANNRAIIENANVIVNNTLLPYRLIPCQLKCNGLDQNLEFAQIKSIKDDIALSLYGSNIDFFSIIKGLKLEDLGDAWLLNWNVNQAANTHNATSGIIWALIDMNADSYMNPALVEIDVRGLLPSVYLHSVIAEIITQAGFTAEGTFLTDENYMSVVLPCGDTKIGAVKPRMLSTAEISTPLTVTSPASAFLEFDTATYDPLTLIQDAPGWAWVYKAYLTGDYSIRITLNVTVNSGGASVVVNKRIAPGFSLFQIGTTVITGTGSMVLEFTDLPLDIDDEMYFVVVPGLVTTITAGTLEIIDTTTTNTIFGKEIDPSLNMGGNMKQSDLLKDTAQKFGLIFQVNNATRVVSIRRFSEIIANIGNAIDWSDKVDYTEKPELQFDSGYARRNLCRYTDDDTVTKPIGTDSDILIDNDNLEAEKDLFESPFAASEQVERFNGESIAQIKMFTNLGTADEEMEVVEPRYLIVRFHTFSPPFEYKDASSTLTTAEVPLTHFILPGQDFNVGFDDNLLDLYSQEFIALIQEFKSVTMMLRITAADINQLDFFTPVWIELNNQPPAYYYISIIKQFKVTSKESTEVELVKLNT